MGPSTRDIAGAALLSAILIGLVLVLFIGNIPAS